jgi:hypothetical protein
MPAKVEPKEPCSQCGHKFDQHGLVAFDEPADGGLMFCPEHECDCVSTWSVPQHPRRRRPRPVMPPRAIVAGFRALTFPDQEPIAFDRPGHPAFKLHDKAGG